MSRLIQALKIGLFVLEIFDKQGIALKDIKMEDVKAAIKIALMTSNTIFSAIRMNTKDSLS